MTGVLRTVCVLSGGSCGRYLVIFDIILSTMVFYIIGLGLGDPEDISLKAYKVIKACKEVYLEYYTSVMNTSNNQLA